MGADLVESRKIVWEFQVVDGGVVVLGDRGVDGFEQLWYFRVDKAGVPAKSGDGVGVEGTDLHIGEVFGEFVGENAVDLWFRYQVAEADAAEVFPAEGVCRHEFFGAGGERDQEEGGAEHSEFGEVAAGGELAGKENAVELFDSFHLVAGEVQVANDCDVWVVESLGEFQFGLGRPPQKGIGDVLDGVLKLAHELRNPSYMKKY